MELLIPSGYVPLDEIKTPLIFLAGPIGGGEKGGVAWQTTALEFFLPYEVTVASPKAYEPEDPVYKYLRIGDGQKFHDALGWERYYLRGAAQKGCLVLWMPEESKTHPKLDGIFGRDTRPESGEWRAKCAANRNLRIEAGIEPGFSGASVVQRNFWYEFQDPDRSPLLPADQTSFTFHDKLEDTLRAALVRCGI